jgi:hypothetical protein
MNETPRTMASVPAGAAEEEEPEEGKDASKSTAPGTGHMTKTTSWKVGLFVEKVETQTSTPPEYPGPSG